MKLDKKILPYITAITMNIIFGLSFLFSKMGLAVSDPITLVSFRFLLAFTVMTLLLMFRIAKVSYKGKPVKLLLLLAIVEPIIYFIFETFGLQRISSSLGGLMLSLIPVVVTILGIYFLNEIPSSKRVLYIVLSVSGVILIVLMDGGSKGDNSLLGVLFLAIAVTSAGFFSILSRKVSKEFTAFEATYFMMFSGAAFFNVISLCRHIYNGNLNLYFEPLKNMNFIISILYLGIISSVVAYFLANFTLSKLEASKSSIFSNVSTIVAIIAGVVVLKESFHSYHLIGAIMIILGVWGTNNSK